jgi:hypothetical protein
MESNASPEVADSAAPPQRALWLWLLAALPVACGLLSQIQPTALAALTVLPRWGWLLAGLGTQLLLWRKRSALPWRVGLGLWLLFAVLFLEEPASLARMLVPPHAPAADAATLCVLSINCAVGNPRVIEDLLPHQPDLVLIQESPGLDVLDDWRQRLFGEGGQLVRGAGRDCALLARGELIEIPVPAESPFVTALWRPRPGSEIRVISLRLWPQELRLDYWNPDCWRTYARTRRWQVEEMQEIAAALDRWPANCPQIVGGDFNCPAGDPVDNALRGRGLQDAFSLAGRGWGKTITNDLPFHRIDRIWLTRELTPRRLETLSTRHSDHRLVKCVWELSSPSALGSRR